MPKAEAARRHNIPRTTLLDKLSGRRKVEDHVKTYLSAEEEKELVKFIVDIADRSFRRTSEEFLTVVKNMLDFRGENTRFKNNAPGYKWFRLF